MVSETREGRLINMARNERVVLTVSGETLRDLKRDLRDRSRNILAVEFFEEGDEVGYRCIEVAKQSRPVAAWPSSGTGSPDRAPVSPGRRAEQDGSRRVGYRVIEPVGAH
jgi:hypothetical protein